MQTFLKVPMQRASSAAPSRRSKAPSRHVSQTPTIAEPEKLAEVTDEGYSSLPQNKIIANAIQESMTGFDRLADIDDEEEFGQEAPKEADPYFLKKWSAMSKDEDSDHHEHDDGGSMTELSNVEKILPGLQNVSISNEEPSATDASRNKWIDGVPILGRLFGDKRGKRDNKVSDSPKQGKRKMISFTKKQKQMGQIQSSNNTLLGASARDLKGVEEETFEDERERISDEPPNFNTSAEARLASLNQKQFEQKYTESRKQIGTGGHSTVKLAIRTSDGQTVVCKYMQHTSVWNWYECPETKRKIPLEVHLMQKFTRQAVPGIIGYIEHFDMAGKYIIIMQYMGTDWMDLYDYIETFGPVVEKHTREIFSRVVNTIDYMHNLGYCHNDIKDENILINPHTREVKLIDFGSTTQLIPGRKFELFYGTKKFASPQAVFGEAYDPAAQEVWCLGTLLYVLIFKMDPFKDDAEIARLEVSGRIDRLRACGRKDGGADVSVEGRDALVRLLHKDHRRRIKCADIRNLPYLG